MNHHSLSGPHAERKGVRGSESSRSDVVGGDAVLLHQLSEVLPVDVRLTRGVADVALVLLISNKEVLSDVEVSGTFSSTLSPIGFQQHGTSVVLEQGVLSNWIALSFQEELGPYHWTHSFIRSYHFCFSGASRIHTLFTTDGGDRSITHGEGYTGVTSEVWMHRERSVNMPS